MSSTAGGTAVQTSGAASDLQPDGPDGATSVVVADLLPAGLTFQSAAASQGAYDGGGGLWSVGSIAAGESHTLAITATVNAGTAGTTITNTATIAAVDQREAPNGNAASADIAAALSLAISSAAGSRASRSSIVSGRLVRNLVEGDLVPGRHDAQWDGRDGYGRRVASGVYFVRFDSAEYRATRKVVRMR